MTTAIVCLAEAKSIRDEIMQKYQSLADATQYADARACAEEAAKFLLQLHGLNTDGEYDKAVAVTDHTLQHLKGILRDYEDADPIRLLNDSLQREKKRNEKHD